MFHRRVLVVAALVASLVFFILGAVGFASGAATPEPLAYGLVDPHGGGTPTFAVQENMVSVRRVGVGVYCLRSTIRFTHKPLAVVTADLGDPTGGQGFAFSDSQSTLCAADEAAVATYRFVRGSLRPSNTIRFVGDSIG